MLCVDFNYNEVGRGSVIANKAATMPVDYASYLLAASPPGFDMAYALRDQFGLEDSRKRTRNNPYSPIKPIILTASPNSPLTRRRSKSNVDFSCSNNDLDEVSEGIATLLVEEFQAAKSNSLPIAARRSVSDFDLFHNKNNCAKGNGGLKKKSVSFADDLGKRLVEVRILHEGPDVPPTLRPEILSSLAQGAHAAVTDAPPLVLNFQQPASNYAAFREKVSNSCVSLENIIVKEYKLIGTVKVKNISFEKRVLIRYTCDSWDSHSDIIATYVQNVTSSSSFGGGYQTDTFSFELAIPPTFDPKKKILFAVLYETNGQQYWDNNEGKNYEVVSANYKCPETKSTDNGVFDLHHDDKWTEFSNWKAVDNSLPYW